MANGLIETGVHESVLVIGAERLSFYLDWSKRDSAVLFGDGASAAVVVASADESGIIDTYLGCDGNNAELLMIPAGGSRTPLTEKNINSGQHYVKMRGSEVFKLAVKAMVKTIRHILTKNNLTISDIDLIIPHQANVRILDATAQTLKIDRDKMYVNLDKYGNTSAASIGLALDEAVQNKKVQPGNLVLLVAFGSGFTWGATLIRW